MLIVALCPGSTVRGRLGDANVKYGVEIAALLMVMEEEPELVAVADNVLLLPAATLPKSIVETLIDRVFCCWWLEEPTLSPWQPAMKVMPARTSKAPAALPKCFARILVAAVFGIIRDRTIPDSATSYERGMAQRATVSIPETDCGRYP